MVVNIPFAVSGDFATGGSASRVGYCSGSHPFQSLLSALGCLILGAI
jgi:hypothetical protein